jgi:septal ring factor EnvC (AmiA/AmiB activator)
MNPLLKFVLEWKSTKNIEQVLTHLNEHSLELPSPAQAEDFFQTLSKEEEQKMKADLEDAYQALVNYVDTLSAETDALKQQIESHTHNVKAHLSYLKADQQK